MKKFLISIALCLSTSLALCQSLPDSLRKLIHETDDPNTRVDLLNTLAYELLDYSLEESLQTSEEALRQSRSANYAKGEAWAHIYTGMNYLISGRVKDALMHDNEALALANKLMDVNLRAYANLQLGKAFRDYGFFDSARVFLNRAKAIQLTQPNPLVLANIYSALQANALHRNLPEQAIEYAIQGLEQAKLSKNNQRIAYAWLDLGDAYRESFSFVKARECYARALEIGGTNDWAVVDYYESIGLLQFMEGDLELSFESLLKVARAYEVYHSRHALARTLIKIGEILEEKGLLDLANEYMMKGMRIAEESSYYFLIAEGSYEMAWINYRNSNLALAQADVDKAVSLFVKMKNKLRQAGCYNMMGLIQMKKKNFDSAMMLHQRSLAMRKEMGNKAAISSSIFNLGELFLSVNRYKDALPYFLESKNLDTEIGDRYGIGLANNRLGKVYTYTGQYSLAQENLNQALTIAQQNGASDLLSLTYNDLATLHEFQGDYKTALQYRKLFQIKYDSIYNKISAQSMASYRTIYELNQKDQQINLLSKDKIIQAEQLRLRNFGLYTAIAMVVIVLLFAIAYYRYSRNLRRFNMQLSERNEEIQTQSEELQESNNALINFNNKITQQREEIAHQAEELRVSHETISRINEGLEKMIELRTSELRSAYQELDTFFYRSSHDFRRPLTTLMGLAEVAKLSVHDDAALDLFQKVNVTAVNLDRMLQKLQSISDVGSLQLVVKEVPLRGIIDELVSNQRAALSSRGIQLTVDVKLSRSFVSYPVLVKIIIENLIENAIVFGALDRPYIIIRAVEKIHDVVVEVEDNGEGIRDDIKENIFEMFFRGSERSAGNGLGLYIAKKAVDKLNGKISFERMSDSSGTRFKVVMANLLSL